MRINQLRDLIAIVEAGSIRAAARSLGVSQPAMTKSMRQLEDQLHVRLLERTAHGVVPTEAGRAFLARARAAQAELRKGEEELAELTGSRAGAVAFGIGPFSGALLVPDALVWFRRDYPLARVRIVEGIPRALLQLVRDETLDFVVGRKLVVKLDAGVKYRPLFSIHLVVAGRRGHPLNHKQSLRDLIDAPWVTGGDLLEETFVLARLSPPRSIVRCESNSVQLGVLAKTDTLGLLPRPMLRDSFGREFLQEIPTTEQIPPLMLGMFTRAQTRLAPVAAAMAKALTVSARTQATSETARSKAGQQPDAKPVDASDRLPAGLRPPASGR
jgi:LysR family transcriptional regulator of abg operon